MRLYELLYRFGQTPWEQYAVASAKSIAAQLDRVEAAYDRPFGRALDLGCGRGVYAEILAARGWQVVGVDNVASAIDAASARGIPNAVFRVADVTDLPRDLGRFDVFLDIGCFQHLDRSVPAQRALSGRSLVAGAANDLPDPSGLAAGCHLRSCACRRGPQRGPVVRSVTVVALPSEGENWRTVGPGRVARLGRGARAPVVRRKRRRRPPPSDRGRDRPSTPRLGR
ncbi:MAG: class I SAM-dependent methyltransferase [Tetrasphaera sp.]